MTPRAKKVTLALVALIILAALGTAYAAGPGGFLGRGGHFKMEPYRLLFNEEQTKKLDALLEPSKQETGPLMKQLMSEGRALKDMIKDPSASDAALKTQVAKLAEIGQLVVVKRAALVRAVRKIATPEQLAKIDAMESRHQKHRERFMGALEKEMQGVKGE